MELYRFLDILPVKLTRKGHVSLAPRVYHFWPCPVRLLISGLSGNGIWPKSRFLSGFVTDIRSQAQIRDFYPDIQMTSKGILEGPGEVQAPFLGPGLLIRTKSRRIFRGPFSHRDPCRDWPWWNSTIYYVRIPNCYPELARPGSISHLIIMSYPF